MSDTVPATVRSYRIIPHPPENLKTMFQTFLETTAFDYNNFDINNRILIPGLQKDRPLLCPFHF